MPDLSSHSDFQKHSLEQGVVGLLMVLTELLTGTPQPISKTYRFFWKGIVVLRMTSPKSHVWLADF